MKSPNFRIMLLLGSAIATAHAYGQSQAQFADATNATYSVAPGYAYRVDLKSTFTGALYWEFKVAGSDGLGRLVRVSTPAVQVTRNRIGALDKKAVRMGLNPILAGGNAVQAAASTLGVDTQIVRFEAVPKSNGTIRYRVLLNILGDEGGALDQDLEATLDGSGKVIKLIRNDD